MKSCSTCRYYFEVTAPTEKHPGDGQCRRRAPTVGFVALQVPGREGIVHKPERCTSFPAVEGNVWCGEFDPCESTGSA